MSGPSHEWTQNKTKLLKRQGEKQVDITMKIPPIVTAQEWEAAR
jgi:hypothetical protein